MGYLSHTTSRKRLPRFLIYQVLADATDTDLLRGIMVTRQYDRAILAYKNILNGDYVSDPELKLMIARHTALFEGYADAKRENSMNMNKKNINYHVILLIVIFAVTAIAQCETIGQKQAESIAEGFVQAGDDIALYYQISGTGPDTIVVLHGGPGLNFGYLAPDLLPLAESHTLIFYDQRGSARSTLITDSSLVHIDKHIEDIEALQRHFGLQNMFLLGHSWGAGLAARYALKYPDQLSGMILVGAMAPRYEPHWDKFRRNRSAWMDDEVRSRGTELVAERNAATDPAEYQRLCRKVAKISFAGMFHDPHDPENFKRMQGDYCSPALSPEARESSRLVSILTWRSIENWNWLDDFHETDVPVLVIHGKSDPMPLASAREWADAFPYARFAVIENAGHKPYIERPDEFFQTVTEFLQKIMQ